MKIITNSSWKGGTGKTTENTFEAETLAMHGYRVLIIDLDSNCAISQVYGKELSDRTSKDFISGQCVEPYNVKKNIDIIPSDLNMSLLANIMDTQLKIQIHKFIPADRYDYILIDPPGSWCAQTRNAIFASDTLVISGTCSRLDFRATKNYFEQLGNCCIDADVYVVCNKYNKNLNEPGVYEDYQKEFGDYLIEPPIPDIKSLKKLTADPDYAMNPTVQHRLEKFVQRIAGCSFNTEGNNA